MLERIQDIVKNRVSLEIDERRNFLENEIGRVKVMMSAKGTFFSSATINKILEVLKSEFRIRGSIIWGIYARAIEDAGIKITKDLSIKLKENISTIYESSIEDIYQTHKKEFSAKKGIWASMKIPSMEDIKRSELKRVLSEIDFAILKHENILGDMPQHINIYQSYGIVQTGSNSTAKMDISIAITEKNEITEALSTLGKEIEKLKAGNEPEYDQIEDLINVAKVELEKEKPAKYKLFAALQGIATFIQTVAVSPQIYEMIRRAFSLLGIQF